MLDEGVPDGDLVPARVVGRRHDRRVRRRRREEVAEARVGGGLEGDHLDVGDLELPGAGRVVTVVMGPHAVGGDEEARGVGGHQDSRSVVLVVIEIRFLHLIVKYQDFKLRFCNSVSVGANGFRYPTSVANGKSRLELRC